MSHTTSNAIVDYYWRLFVGLFVCFYFAGPVKCSGIYDGHRMKYKYRRLDYDDDDVLLSSAIQNSYRTCME